MVITGQELKTKGSSALKKALSQDSVVFVSVRGQQKYVVIPIETYESFRDFELEKALQESIDDRKNSRISARSLEEHIRKIENEI